MVKRVIYHLASPFSIRSVLGVMMLFSALGFAYAIFNERRITAMVNKRDTQIQQVQEITLATHAKTDSILNDAALGREATKQELEFMREVNTALRTLSEQLKTATPTLVPPKPKSQKPKPKKKIQKTCLKETERRTSHGNSAVLIERIIVPTPCQ